MIQFIFFGRNRGSLDREEKGESPYDPIDLPSRTISQPKLFPRLRRLRLQKYHKVILEHQRALNERKTQKKILDFRCENVRRVLLFL